jgi:small subunit ribosomal protein S18
VSENENLENDEERDNFLDDEDSRSEQRRRGRGSSRDARGGRGRDRDRDDDQDDEDDRGSRRRRGVGGGRGRRRRKEDYFVVNDTVPDYKDVDTLRRFITDRAKIRPRRQTGLSAKNQRRVAQAIKRARHMALLPFTDEQTRR